MARMASKRDCIFVIAVKDPYFLFLHHRMAACSNQWFTLQLLVMCNIIYGIGYLTSSYYQMCHTLHESDTDYNS